VNNNLNEYGDPGISELEGGRNRVFPGRRTFRSFKNPVYRLYYGALLGQMAAMNMQMLARSLLIYRISGSAAILGATALAHALPMLFLALFGGVIADRLQKKIVMLMGQAASAIVSLAVALSLSFGYLSADREGSWWILIVASVCQGTIMGLMMPSRQAIVREIVSQDDLMNAISLSTMGMNSLRFFAPALTGFLIDAFDFQAVYYTMAGLYLISVVFLLLMPYTSKITPRHSNALTDIKEGFKYIRHETTILLVLIFTLIIVLFSMPYQMLLPVFADDILKVGATWMGVLMSVSGAGAIFGAMVLASLPNKKRGIMLLYSALVLGLALIFFAFSESMTLSLILIVFVGLGTAGRMALGNTLLQYYTEDEYRGRVMSIYMMEFGLTSFSAFAAGIMTEAIGVQWSVGGFAVTLVCFSILALFFVPKLRKLD